MMLSRPDDDLGRDVTEALRRSLHVPETVTARVVDHRVHLGGTASWQHQREAAGLAVGSLRGVRAVINDIDLHPASSYPELTVAIRAALVASAQREGEHLTVTRDETGAITLRGTVRSCAERRQAEQVCWSTPGVTAVSNDLDIRDCEVV
jgi:osmotically-inducible protein OsmY